jgi:mono/diheme cytochrome c family protein
VRALAVFALFALLAAGCGSGEVITPTAQTVVGTLPGATTTTPEPVPPEYANGNPVAGKPIFQTKGCTACHTLKDAGATGTVGPNLDISQPSLGRAIDRLLHGGTLNGAAMPPFKGVLSTKQIADVAAYVVKASRSG